MIVLEYNIPYNTKSTKSYETFRIYPLGDIHAGSIHCAEEDIKAQIQTIKDTPNSYIIGMGDYADCILKNDKRFDIAGLAPWVKKDNILETQRDWLVDLFSSVKDKVLGFLTGNHEETIHLHYQNDFTKNLCKDLGVPYAGYSAFFNLTFDRANSNESHTYTIHAWHGSGGAQTEGSRVMRLMRLVNEFQAHIYLMGHLHTTTVYTPDRIICQRGRLKSIKLAAAITGSWLKAYTQPKKGEEMTPSYAEIKGYKPSRLGCPVVEIIPALDNFLVEA